MHIGALSAQSIRNHNSVHVTSGLKKSTFPQDATDNDPITAAGLQIGTGERL